MVPVVVELSRQQLSVSQLRRMQPGDLLELGGIKQVELRIGGKPLLMGEPGEQDGSRSVRVVRRIGPKARPEADR